MNAQLIVGGLSAIVALVASICWIKAADAKVLSKFPDTLGSGFDGVMNVKNEKGEVLDLVGTYEKQSYWNSKAALLSGIAGILAVLSWTMTPLCKYLPAWSSLCA
jgi:hypothetical protein